MGVAAAHKHQVLGSGMEGPSKDLSSGVGRQGEPAGGAGAGGSERRQ